MTVKELKRVVIGRPLKNELMNDEKYNVLWGLPILSSDAISSVAYAGQEILLVLIPAIGLLAYSQLTYISLAIIGLLILLTLSYTQTIDNYPNGGGAYIVAKDNIGATAGIIAGAALSIDYILTVAVSVSSGVEQITSAFTSLCPYTVLICIFMVSILMVGNLRGVRESSRMFGIPAYAFIFGILGMIILGIIKYKMGFVPPEPTIRSIGQPITLILLLKAFSSGCTALTGVEAVSNAVPAFKSPSVKYAKTVLILLSLVVLLLFGGTSILANIYHVVPENGAVLIQIAELIFGNNFMFYYVTATTFIILIMAANTAYSGFPLLVSIMAYEGYAPRQLTIKGDRLSYSNGIIILSAIATLLITLFRANVTSLIGLYAVGVFISFTLSQFGMFLKWNRHKGKNWIIKAIINGFGSLVTFIVVAIIAVSKFNEGAWIVVILIPILVIIMKKVKNHYTAISKQLRIKPEELSQVDISNTNYRNRVIVPIQGVNKASIRALRYAKTISDNVVAFNISIDEEGRDRIESTWRQINTDIPLVVKYSPFRKIVEPLLKFIESVEYDYKKGDMITVILPEFGVKSWWHKILHNHTRAYVEKQLLRHKHIVIATMPLQMSRDEVALNTIKE